MPDSTRLNKIPRYPRCDQTRAKLRRGTVGWLEVTSAAGQGSPQRLTPAPKCVQARLVGSPPAEPTRRERETNPHPHRRARSTAHHD